MTVAKAMRPTRNLEETMLDMGFKLVMVLAVQVEIWWLMFLSLPKRASVPSFVIDLLYCRQYMLPYANDDKAP